MIDRPSRPPTASPPELDLDGPLAEALLVEFLRNETAKARTGLSSNGSPILPVIAGQASPWLPMDISPAPTSAPVSACVVDTGRPVLEATNTHAIAPTRIACANAGGVATPG